MAALHRGGSCMKETDLATLQHLASQYLIRHRSVLDVQSKLNESAARVSRALANAVASCGCVTTLFYQASFCNITGQDLDANLRKERDRVSALGVYHLT